MKRLANTVGERINEFDNWFSPMVFNFNIQFPECPIKDFDDEEPVIILGPAPGNCREILVGETIIVHKMFSDLLYGVDKQVSALLIDEEELDEIMGHPV